MNAPPNPNKPMSNNAQIILFLSLSIPAVGYVGYIGWLTYMARRAERKGR